MSFDYVVVPAILLVIGSLLVWLCARRLLSLSTRSYRTWRKVTERILLSMAAVLVTAVVLCSVYNAIAIQVFLANNPPQGKLYSVNGHKMHLYCTGSGSPAIVLEAGLGGGSATLSWGGIQPELAKFTRVCSYDRAGYGWSDPQPGPADADRAAANLHELLTQTHVTGPLVLMGHSLGGIYLRDFAAHYPADIAGMILLDSATPLQEERFAAKTGEPAEPNPTMLALTYKTLFIVGIPRLMGMCGRPAPGMEIHAGKALGEDECQLRLNPVLNELGNMRRTGEETVNSGPFGDLPILIVSHDPAQSLSMPHVLQQMVDMENIWSSMQEDLKKLSTRSRRIVAKGSGHGVHNDRKDLVLKETHLFIEQIRGTAPQPADYGSTIVE